MSRLTLRLAAAAIATLPLASHAVDGITDRPGDFLATFGGNASMTDLDVLAATVLYDASTDLFKLSATFAGAVGSTANALYVWGVNRGAGTAGFAAIGLDGVRFDRVVLLNPNGSGQIGGGPALPAGSITVLGNTLTAVVSGSVLPSTGFSKLNYTWNLWPRNTTYSGTAALADFAPDNSNFTSTPGIVPVATPVPEPATVLTMLAGLGAIALRRRLR